MSKNQLLKRYFVFLAGLFINSLGVSLITKSNLGTSPISSIPYVLSLHYIPTLGQFTILFSLLLIALQILILGRKFQLISLLQIPVSIAFGYFIDLSMIMLSWLNPSNYAYRAVSLLIGCLVLGFGVYIEVIADVVMLPGEAFVNIVASKFHFDFGKTKVVFDTTMTVMAGLMGVVIYQRLAGVREGTIIAAVLVGMIARVFKKKIGFIEKYLRTDNTEGEQEIA